MANSRGQICIAWFLMRRVCKDEQVDSIGATLYLQLCTVITSDGLSEDDI